MRGRESLDCVEDVDNATIEIMTGVPAIMLTSQQEHACVHGRIGLMCKAKSPASEVSSRGEKRG